MRLYDWAVSAQYIQYKQGENYLFSPEWYVGDPIGSVKIFTQNRGYLSVGKEFWPKPENLYMANIPQTLQTEINVSAVGNGTGTARFAAAQVDLSMDATAIDDHESGMLIVDYHLQVPDGDDSSDYYLSDKFVYYFDLGPGIDFISGAITPKLIRGVQGNWIKGRAIIAVRSAVKQYFAKFKLKFTFAFSAGFYNMNPWVPNSLRLDFQVKYITLWGKAGKPPRNFPGDIFPVLEESSEWELV